MRSGIEPATYGFSDLSECEVGALLIQPPQLVYSRSLQVTYLVLVDSACSHTSLDIFFNDRLSEGVFNSAGQSSLQLSNYRTIAMLSKSCEIAVRIVKVEIVGAPGHPQHYGVKSMFRGKSTGHR